MWDVLYVCVFIAVFQCILGFVYAQMHVKPHESQGVIRQEDARNGWNEQWLEETLAEQNIYVFFCDVSMWSE